MRRETATKEVLQILLPDCTVEFIVTSVTDAVAAPGFYSTERKNWTER
jgi:hypothetical protein